MVIVKKSTIIYNGYDTKKFKFNPSKKRRFKKKFFIKKNEIILGFVARWSRQKDFEMIFQTFKIVIAKNRNIKLLLIGNGITFKNHKLIYLLRKFSILDKTILINETHKIHHYLNIIDLGLFASKGNEGFPNVVAEKMSMGIPMVSNNQGDVRLIIKKSRTCYFNTKQVQIL